MHIVFKKNTENMREEWKEEWKGLCEQKSIKMLNLAS